MKRRDVLRKVRVATKAEGVSYSERELTRHTSITVGAVSTTVPRHQEISNLLAEAIFRQMESELGKGWWRR